MANSNEGVAFILQNGPAPIQGTYSVASPLQITGNPMAPSVLEASDCPGGAGRRRMTCIGRLSRSAARRGCDLPQLRPAFALAAIIVALFAAAICAAK